MAPRLQLHELFKGFTENVYFQPPNNLEMRFPCIKYERDSNVSEFAGNRPYLHAKRYQVTVIDRDPDSSIASQVEDLPLCRFDRFFAADNLNHFVFNLFF